MLNRTDNRELRKDHAWIIPVHAWIKPLGALCADAP